MTLFRARVFADEIELRMLKWEDYPGLPGWALNEIMCLHRRKAEVNMTQTEEKRTGNITMEAKTGE